MTSFAASHFIGRRYLRAKRANHFISFISLTSIVGMTLGVAVLILVLSVMNGADRELQTRILGTVPHLVLKGEQPIANWQATRAQVDQHPDVIASAPYFEIQAMLAAGGEVAPALVYGIEPALEAQVNIVGDYTQGLELDALKPGEWGINLGSRLARQLQLVPGEHVTVVIPQASVTIAGVMPRFKRLKFLGAFSVGAELDGQFAYMHLSDAGQLMRAPGRAQGVRVELKDLFKSRQVTQDLVNQQPELIGFDWTFTHGTLFQAIKMEKAMMALLLFLIVAVAIFNILSSLVMLVAEKKGDIAILMTMGATPAQIRRIFMVQGSCIGLFGALSGGGLGVLAALTISDAFAWVERATGQDLFSAYFIDYLPSHLQWGDVFWVCGLSFVLSILSTWYPAQRAANIDPVEALRYE